MSTLCTTHCFPEAPLDTAEGRAMGGDTCLSTCSFLSAREGLPLIVSMLKRTSPHRQGAACVVVI